MSKVFVPTLPLIICACVGGVLSGCGSPAGSLPSAKPDVVATQTDTSSAPAAEADPSVEATPDDHDPLARVPQTVREEIDLFAFSTLQLQRVTLLQESRVQEDLGLSADQIAAFKALGEDVGQMRSALQSLPAAERHDKLKNEYRPKAAEYQRAVDGALNDAQERRLWQKVLQRQHGAIIFLLPGVPEELKLTGEQQAFLYELIESTRQSVDFNNLKSPLERGKIFLKATAARKKAEEQLTAVQKDAWKRLLDD